MKAVLISKKYNFTNSRFEEIAEATTLKGYEILASNVFLFDLSIASHLLANIQNFLNDMGHPYHVIYLQGEPVMFQHPGKIAAAYQN